MAIPKLLSELRNKRVGLVLAGGGFKGSYQIGVWLALRALGIRKLHAIAGTSVGALNAVLIANNDPKQAKRIWRETSIMRWSPRGIRIVATAYSLLLGPVLFAYLGLLC